MICAALYLAESLHTCRYRIHTRLLLRFCSFYTRIAFGVSFRFPACTSRILFSAEISAPHDVVLAIAFHMFCCTFHFVVLFSYRSQKSANFYSHKGHFSTSSASIRIKMSFPSKRHNAIIILRLINRYGVVLG